MASKSFKAKWKKYGPYILAGLIIPIMGLMAGDFYTYAKKELKESLEYRDKTTKEIKTLKYEIRKIKKKLKMK